MLHDLGKKATQTKDAEGVSHYYFHEAESARLIEARRVLERNEQLNKYPLLKIVRLHMGPFMKGYMDAKKSNRLGEYFDSYIKNNKLTLEDFRFLVLSIFIDMYYPHPENKYFFNDMARIKDAVAYMNEKMIKKGGIDLTRDKIGLQVQNGGQGVQFKFDSAMIQQLQNASGLTPVIIDIHPMTTSVPMFLGDNDGLIATGKLSMR